MSKETETIRKCIVCGSTDLETDVALFAWFKQQPDGSWLFFGVDHESNYAGSIICRSCKTDMAEDYELSELLPVSTIPVHFITKED